MNTDTDLFEQIKNAERLVREDEKQIELLRQQLDRAETALNQHTLRLAALRTRQWDQVMGKKGGKQ